MRKRKSISGQRSYIISLIGKTAGDNIVRFISRMNQHISDSRTQVSTWKFPIHVCKCRLKNKCLNEPFFETNLMMKLKSSHQLEIYENYFHKKGNDTLNCPDHLKKLHHKSNEL